MTTAINRQDLAAHLLRLAQELDDRANNLAMQVPFPHPNDPTTNDQIHELDNLLQAADSLADYLVKS